MTSREAIRRIAPLVDLPAYAFVGGGLHPHPSKSGVAHSGLSNDAIRPLDPPLWSDNLGYRYAIDLFNLGYYWEAHEIWEQLWILAGRKRSVADLLRGLIKLAASALKVRQNMPRGVEKHSRSARAIFLALSASLNRTWFCGLSLDILAQHARRIERQPDTLRGDITKTVEVVFAFSLSPRLPRR